MENKKKIIANILILRWTLVFSVVAALFWAGVYFFKGSMPMVQYVFIESDLMGKVDFTNISWYKFFLLDKIFPPPVPLVSYVHVAQLPLSIPRWFDVLLIPLFFPLICFIVKKEYYEANEKIKGFIGGLYLLFFILVFVSSLREIMLSITAYIPLNADLGTDDFSFGQDTPIGQYAWIWVSAVGGFLNGLYIGANYWRINPVRTSLSNLLFVFASAMLVAGLSGGIAQGFIVAVIFTLGNFYTFIVMLIVIFLFMFILRIFTSIITSSPVLALRRWLGVTSKKNENSDD